MQEKNSYWQQWNNLLALLQADGKLHIAEGLNEARRYVNGYTDGWHEFVNKAKEVMVLHGEELTPAQIEIAEDLLSIAKHQLRV